MNLSKTTSQAIKFATISCGLFILCSACKSSPERAKEADPVAQCTEPDARDPMSVLSPWMRARDGRNMSKQASTLVDTWPSQEMHLVRAWRVDPRHWIALIAHTPEPSPDEDVLMVSMAKSAEGTWNFDTLVQVTSASALWPQL